ncbi:MAG: hypothetical protein GXN99_00530 [Candidatus Nanohaloarchaeota archaeon]|nr:hypothetical protein [Candidatus Nanohaloarchaeota archaeon]
MLRKAQAGTVFAIILLLLGLASYAFIIKGKDNNEGNLLLSNYIQDYASSMLTSLLRSSTGNPLAGCETVKDVLAKAYYSPENGKCCGIADYTCREYAQLIVQKKIDDIISNAKKNYIYYFEFGKKFSSSPVLFAYPPEHAFIKDCKCEKIIVEQKLIDSVRESRSYPYARIYVVRIDEVPDNTQISLHEPNTDEEIPTPDVSESPISYENSYSDNDESSESSSNSQTQDIISFPSHPPLESSFKTCRSDNECEGGEACCVSSSCLAFPDLTAKCLNEEVYELVSSSRSLDRSWYPYPVSTSLYPGEYKVFLYYTDADCEITSDNDYDLHVSIHVPSCHSGSNLLKMIIYAGEECEYLPTTQEEIQNYLEEYRQYLLQTQGNVYSTLWCSKDVYCRHDTAYTMDANIKFNYDVHPLRGCYLIVLWNYLKPPSSGQQPTETYLEGVIPVRCHVCSTSNLACHGEVTVTAGSPCFDSNARDRQYVRELRELGGRYTPEN